MPTEKKLLVVGTGNVGNAIAKRFSKTEHVVQVGSRTADRGQEVAARHGVEGGEAADFVDTADVIFLAIPFSDLDDNLNRLGSMAGKIVVDCTNPLTEDFMELTIGHDNSAGEEVQKRLPDTKVVKAFNAVFADVMEAAPDYGSTTPQIFCASDHDDAKEVVSELIRAIGYEPVNCGPLKNARHLEPLAEIIIQLAYVMGEGTHITPVIVRAS